MRKSIVRYVIGRGGEGRREVRERPRHPLDELLGAALLEQQPGMAALERLEHHELGPQQADALDIERRRPLDLGRLGQVDEQLGPRHRPRRHRCGGRRRGHRRGGKRALAGDALSGVDGHDLAVAQLLGRIAAPGHAWDAGLA